VVRGFSKLKFTVGLAALAVVCFLARGLWLPWMGSLLVHEDAPAKADMVLVLAGDPWGHRLVRGAELVKQGYAPAVLVSGPPGIYGINEADAAIQFMVAKGYPKDWFIPLRHTAMSTRTEAEVTLVELRRRNVHNFLLVTSDFHTARARRIYREVEREQGGGPEFRTVAAPDEFFRADNWWHSRQAQKTVFMEWSKTLATAVGM
jgi:uncharacterized SAM-binding protein YcdF (DUF218 family)